MQRILFAFIALAVAAYLNGALLMPIFSRMSERRAAQLLDGRWFDPFGFALWIMLALTFGLVYWALNRAWRRWG